MLKQSLEDPEKQDICWWTSLVTVCNVNGAHPPRRRPDTRQSCLVSGPGATMRDSVGIVRFQRRKKERAAQKALRKRSRNPPRSARPESRLLEGREQDVQRDRCDEMEEEGALCQYLRRAAPRVEQLRTAVVRRHTHQESASRSAFMLGATGETTDLPLLDRHVRVRGVR